MMATTPYSNNTTGAVAPASPGSAASILDCLNTLAHELECDPGYPFDCLSDMHGETFVEKLARVRRVIEAASRSEQEDSSGLDFAAQVAEMDIAEVSHER